MNSHSTRGRARTAHSLLSLSWNDQTHFARERTLMKAEDKWLGVSAVSWHAQHHYVSVLKEEWVIFNIYPSEKTTHQRFFSVSFWAHLLSQQLEMQVQDNASNFNRTKRLGSTDPSRCSTGNIELLLRPNKCNLLHNFANIIISFDWCFSGRCCLITHTVLSDVAKTATGRGCDI